MNNTRQDISTSHNCPIRMSGIPSITIFCTGSFSKAQLQSVIKVFNTLSKNQSLLFNVDFVTCTICWSGWAGQQMILKPLKRTNIANKVLPNLNTELFHP